MGITKLTVCLPTYNGELFIAESVRASGVVARKEGLWGVD